MNGCVGKMTVKFERCVGSESNPARHVNFCVPTARRTKLAQNTLTSYSAFT